MALDKSITAVAAAKDHIKIGDQIEVTSLNFRLSQLGTSEQPRMTVANMRGADQRRRLSMIYPAWLVWATVASLVLIGAGGAIFMVAIAIGSTNIVAIASIVMACGLTGFLFILRTGKELRSPAEHSISDATIPRYSQSIS